MKSIIKKYGQGQPALVIVACLHGDEIVGRRVIDELYKLKIIKGQLKTIIANQAALEKGVRFIDQDLNRSFPGNKNSNLAEEKIAHYILQEIKYADYIVDIHSTSTDTKDVMIIKKRDAQIDQMIRFINPRRVLLMSENYGQQALVNFCSGVSIEYGRHKAEDTFIKSLQDIKTLMHHLGMIKMKDVAEERSATENYQVFDVASKPAHFRINKNIHNFVKVLSGDVLGYINNRPVLAKEDFYPVLFGEQAYKDIIGFKASKIK
jgi:predicted deacylase